MNVKKGYMKVGDDTVLPFTSYDCIIDKDGNKLTESADSITQNTNAVANIQDYLGVDVSRKRNLFDANSYTNSAISTYGGTLTYSYTSGYKPIVRIPIDVVVGKTYTISVSSITNTTSAEVRMIIERDENNVGEEISTVNSVRNITFTAQNGNYTITMYSLAGNGSCTFGDVMLVEGSSASPYVPYVPTLRDMDTSHFLTGLGYFPVQDAGGIQEITVSFGKTLPVVPKAVLLTFQETTFLLEYCDGLWVKSNSTTTNSFVAITKRLKGASSWYFRWVAIY